jgi:hypothetical protein
MVSLEFNQTHDCGLTKSHFSFSKKLNTNKSKVIVNDTCVEHFEITYRVLFSFRNIQLIRSGTAVATLVRSGRNPNKIKEVKLKLKGY